MNTFQEMGLSPELVNTLKNIKFDVPTDIQAQAIPLILAGKDILGSAQTGTGKTGAFGIPLIEKLLRDPKSSALVMTPTRELATQVLQQLHAFLGRKTNINSALLIGGESIYRQLADLRQRPRIIVGTPGRINDHIERRSLQLQNASFLVLDETDRMLDMGFTGQIENVIKHLPTERQTLLFSATLPDNIARIAKKYQIDPVRIAANVDSTAVDKIKQENLKTTEADKYSHLLTQLNQREGSIIIFVKTKHGTEKMAQRLSKEGHLVDAIHGNLNQNRRDRVLNAFRNKKYRILVATNVAARGLDVPHIKHVINYDLPQSPEDYIHRIGRTARAGAEGSALNFITPESRKMWSAIDRLLNPNAPRSRDEDSDRQPYGNRRRRFRSRGRGRGQNSSQSYAS